MDSPYHCYNLSFPFVGLPMGCSAAGQRPRWRSLPLGTVFLLPFLLRYRALSCFWCRTRRSGGAFRVTPSGSHSLPPLCCSDVRCVPVAHLTFKAWLSVQEAPHYFWMALLLVRMLWLLSFPHVTLNLHLALAREMRVWIEQQAWPK